MIGIYMIVNPKGETYFGQSWNLHKRVLAYKRLDCKGQPRIYRSLKKYGVDNHSIKILDHLPEIKNQFELDWWECYCINNYRRYSLPLLNIKDGGKGGRMSEETKQHLSILKKGVLRPQYLGEKNPFFGKKHSDAVRLKMSKSNKGNKVGLRNGRARSINQFSLSNNFIKKWDTIIQASIELNISRQSINDAVSGRHKTAHGFIWKCIES